jgi:peptide/nickel transport system substrate-binding protein
MRPTPLRSSPSGRPLRKARRRPVAVAAGALIAGILTISACGGSAGTKAGTASASSSTFVMGQTSAINNLIPEPLNLTVEPWERALFDTLITLNNSRQPVPSLAVSWDVNTAQTSYVLNLRQGVKFSNGEPLTAQVVANNLTWATKPVNDVFGGPVLKTATITVASPSSVKVTFPIPTPEFLYLLDGLPIMDISSSLAVIGGSDHPIGTGPFVLQSFVPGSSVTMTRNPGYWDKAAIPAVKTYEVRVFPDNVSMQTALTTGQIQGLAFPPLTELASLKKAGDVIASVAPTGSFALEVETKTGPLADEKVREALSLAIDRAAFAKDYTAGQSTPTCSIYPPDSEVYQPSVDASCKYDPQAAKALLAAAGQSNLRFTIITDPPRYAEETAYLPILQNDLAAIGVKMTIDEEDNTLFAEDLLSGHYEVAVNFTAWGDLDPSAQFLSGAFAPALNTENFSSPTYTALVAHAQSVTSQAERLQLYRQLNEYMMQEAFVIPIATHPYIYAVNAQDRGFQLDPLGPMIPSSLGKD